MQGRRPAEDEHGLDVDELERRLSFSMVDETQIDEGIERLASLVLS